jgi:malonyl CoA-acyl carrier protein transacylase
METVRAERGMPLLREIDGNDRFSARLHLAGEHASLVTAACSWVDYERLDHEKVEVVAVAGNSMGWYTALGIAGSLDVRSMALLIDTMGGYQQGHVVGAQLVHPLTGLDWRPDPDRAAIVQTVVDQIPDLYWSIHLGGQAVLAGTTVAIETAMERLPKETRGAVTFPLRLPLHSAFHTPLLHGTSGTARTELAHLSFQAPQTPLVDGTGKSWRPLFADPGGIRTWTLGDQVVAPFDFTTMVQAVLGEYAPDVVILPGPGEGLGGAIAQVMIGMGWRGMKNREDFMTLQRTGQGPLISMCRPDQAARVSK